LLVVVVVGGVCERGREREREREIFHYEQFESSHVYLTIVGASPTLAAVSFLRVT
jgi:hypothetical protein